MGFWSRLLGLQDPATTDKSMKNIPIRGEIGYYGLEDWWLHELDESERKLIINTYKPMGVSNSKSTLLMSNVESSQTTAFWLSVLAGWFKPNDPEQSRLILKIADKAWEVKENLSPATGDDAIFSKHLALGALAEIYYRFREDPLLLERCKAAAQMQVEMQSEAMKAYIRIEKRLAVPGKKNQSIIYPSHKGFKRLAIILEKEKRYEDALKLLEGAANSKWDGDWDKRIERIKKKARSRQC
ncbi:hypothetical protein KJY77_00405 [Canibacter sp. lx-72]|uniref:hypothetical protein n=1 Tax=Canibacter zhuwentaonis TaxID=2837491 RepID=UPI001BDBD4DB|nr:hypothetical protein [Canibacter zhuwentaonis]MBT1017608.1 hypothetical protein [Canibacter zhuwentaonis]